MPVKSRFRKLPVIPPRESKLLITPFLRQFVAGWLLNDRTSGLAINRSHAESSGEFYVAQGFDRLGSRRKLDDSRTYMKSSLLK